MAPTTESKAANADTVLTANSFDGTHLAWQAFRWNVLAPYRVRILDTVPEDRMPKEVIALAEIDGQDMSRFDTQRAKFRAQVPLGRGFGPSPLFPPNLMPSTVRDDRLSRCMIPKCQRDALPERAKDQLGDIYELPLPRPGLACGFSVEAFTTPERSELPQNLTTPGTVVHFETGYVSPGVPVMCPFLTFQRAKSKAEEEVEAAMNSCAIDGSWCVRALQLLYNKAYQGNVIPELPVAFSCTIDNGFAVLNCHWIDHAEEYYTAPFRHFDFEKEEEFSQFLAFIEVIERWALRRLLPQIKAALDKASFLVLTPPMTPDSHSRAAEVVSRTDHSGSDAILRALKRTFSNVPWRMDEDDRTPMPPSAILSPSTRFTVFDFSSVNLNQRIPNYAALRHRRTNSNGGSDTSSPTSFSPGVPPARKPHPPSSLGSNRPVVPLIRMPSSPKDRQNSPSSPAPLQWQQQILALTQEIQTLRRELNEVKSTQPAAEATIEETHLIHLDVATMEDVDSVACISAGLESITEETSAMLPSPTTKEPTKGSPKAVLTLTTTETLIRSSSSSSTTTSPSTSPTDTTISTTATSITTASNSVKLECSNVPAAKPSTSKPVNSNNVSKPRRRSSRTSDSKPALSKPTKSITVVPESPSKSLVRMDSNTTRELDAELKTSILMKDSSKGLHSGNTGLPDVKIPINSESDSDETTIHTESEQPQSKPSPPSNKESSLKPTSETLPHVPQEPDLKHMIDPDASDPSHNTILSHLKPIVIEARIRISRMSFWQIATTVYLGVLLGRMVVSETHREAVARILMP